MRRPLILLAFLPFLITCGQKTSPISPSTPTPQPAAAPVEWLSYKDNYFSFEYPSSWKLNTKSESVMHYRDIMLSLNSMGRENFMVRNMPTENGAEYNHSTTIKQLELGAVYLDVATWSGPSFGNNEFADDDTVSVDLAAPLLTNVENVSGDLATRSIGFKKWGYGWEVLVYSMPPISAENQKNITRVLNSFHFPDYPAGDERWAVRMAHKKLPAEAHPEWFQHVRGGGPNNYVVTKKFGDEVLVNFVLRENGGAEKRWNYRVDSHGLAVLTEDTIPEPQPRKTPPASTPK